MIDTSSGTRNETSRAAANAASAGTTQAREERERADALARDLVAVRRQIEMQGVAVNSDVQNAAQRSEVLARDLAAVRRETEAKDAALAKAREQAAEDKKAVLGLRQALRQECL